MKIVKILSIAAILFVSQRVFSQQTIPGSEYLIKAEKHFKESKIKKALSELKIAEASNYGLCGNAWEGANWEIKYLKSQIYLKQNLFDKALAEIDLIKGCGFGGYCEKSDSLKVEILIKKFGKEKVAHSFKQEKSYIRNISYGNNLASVKLLDLNYNFSFTFIKEYTDPKYDGKELAFLDIPFNEIIKKYNFYKLLE